MRKFKVAFWILNIVIIAYGVIGIKYASSIDFHSYEMLGGAIAFLWLVPAWVTFVDAMMA
jgi:hypothetical protein